MAFHAVPRVMMYQGDARVPLEALFVYSLPHEVWGPTPADPRGSPPPGCEPGQSVNAYSVKPGVGPFPD